MATRKPKAKLTPEVAAYMAAISGRGKGGTARAKALSKARRSEIAKNVATVRMTSLTPERRSEIAKKAVAAREAKRATALKDSQDSPYPFPPPQILLPKLSEWKGGKARAKKVAGASAKVRTAPAKRKTTK